MKVLIVSNECDRKKRLGNPIIPRLVKSLKKNKDIESAAFSPFRNKVSDFLRIRRVHPDGLEWLHLFQKRSDLIRSGSKCTLLSLSAKRGA